MEQKLKLDFIRIVRENEPMMWKLCWFYSSRCCSQCQTAEDIYQEIVLNIWESLPRFKSMDGCKMSTWIYRVASNVAISVCRKNNMQTVPIDELGDEISETGDCAIDEKEDLSSGIARLTEDERRLVSLFLEDLPYKTIALRMGISTSNVGTRMQRIKTKLRHFCD